MTNEQDISNALRLRSRMQSLIEQGYALMGEMQASPSEAYAATLGMIWKPTALAQMPIAMRIIQAALADVQMQCPDLSAEIFPQQQQGVEE